MITSFVVSTLVSFLSLIFSWLPLVTELPFGIDAYVATGMGYVSYVITVFPPLGTIYNGFLVVLAWKGSLLLLRFFKIIN